MIIRYWKVEPYFDTSLSERDSTRYQKQSYSNSDKQHETQSKKIHGNNGVAGIPCCHTPFL